MTPQKRHTSDRALQQRIQLSRSSVPAGNSSQRVIDQKCYLESCLLREPNFHFFNRQGISLFLANSGMRRSHAQRCQKKENVTNCTKHEFMPCSVARATERTTSMICGNKAIFSMTSGTGNTIFSLICGTKKTIFSIFFGTENTIVSVFVFVTLRGAECRVHVNELSGDRSFMLKASHKAPTCTFTSSEVRCCTCSCGANLTRQCPWTPGRKVTGRKGMHSVTPSCTEAATTERRNETRSCSLGLIQPSSYILLRKQDVLRTATSHGGRNARHLAKVVRTSSTDWPEVAPLVMYLTRHSFYK